MNADNKKPVTITIPASLYLNLKIEANTKKISVSKLIKNAIEFWYE